MNRRFEMPHCNELIVDFEKILSKLLGEPVKIMLRYEQYSVGLDELRIMVCEAFGLPWKTVLKVGREKDYIYARMCFAYLAKRFTDIPDGEIAAYIGKHRTTVINSHQTICHLLFVQDLNIYQQLTAIIENIERINPHPLKGEQAKTQN